MYFIASKLLINQNFRKSAKNEMNQVDQGARPVTVGFQSGRHEIFYNARGMQTGHAPKESLFAFLAWYQWCIAAPRKKENSTARRTNRNNVTDTSNMVIIATALGRPSILKLLDDCDRIPEAQFKPTTSSTSIDRLASRSSAVAQSTVQIQ